MKPLFAPWRMEVIESYKKSSACILCELFNSPNDEENLILERSKFSYVVLNKYPYSNGHLMFVPQRHEGDWTQLRPEELSDLMSLSQKATRILSKTIEAQGFNLGANFGRVAGAGIPDHTHLHLVPRWEGDCNFMPIFSEVKVISEHLQATYKKLKAAWEGESI